MDLERFYQEMSQAGCFDSSGSFTIDLRARTDKLRELYSNHPDLWILKLLQAAACVEAKSTTFQTGASAIVFAFRSLQALPWLSTLDGDTEYSRFFKEALEVLDCSRDAWQSLSILQWESDGEGEFLGQTAEGEMTVKRLQQGQGEEFARASSWSSAGPYQLVLELKFRPRGFLGSLGRKGKLAQQIRNILDQRAQLSPLRIKVNKTLFGQGLLRAETYSPFGHSETKFRKGPGSTYINKELACEKFLCPVPEDVFVRNTEPGIGYFCLQHPQGMLVSLGPYRKLLSRWVTEHGLPFFPSVSQAIQSTRKMETGEGTWLDWRRSSPEAEVQGSLHIIKWGQVRGASGYFNLLHSLIQLDKPLIVEQNPTETYCQGLPVSACLSIPQKPSGPGHIEFYRRGLLLERRDADLGVPGARAMVASAWLQTDLLGLGVVQDDTYAELESSLRSRTLLLASQTLMIGHEHDRDVRLLARSLDQDLL